jgi:hypothetical protein
MPKAGRSKEKVESEKKGLEGVSQNEQIVIYCRDERKKSLLHRFNERAMDAPVSAVAQSTGKREAPCPSTTT